MRRILIFLLVAVCAAPMYENLSAIVFSNLPQTPIFQEKLEDFLAYSIYINHYSPEWGYPVSKEDLATKALAFEAEIDKQTNRTYDLELLQLIVLRYMYNIDVENCSQKIEAKVSVLKAQYPNDYRTSWIYGNYLSSSAQIIKGVDEFIHVINRIDDMRLLHPAFLEDYSYSCLFSSMFKNGFRAMETAAELRDVNVSDYRLYNTFKDMLQQPETNKNYADKETWVIRPQGDHFRLLSRILGTSIYLEREWNLKFTGIDNKQSFVLLSPPNFLSSKGKAIGITVLFQLSIADITYDTFSENIKKTISVVNEEVKIINGIRFKVFTFENPSIYTDRGGGRGYYLTAEIQPSEFSNCSIEFPYLVTSNEAETGLSYYPLGQDFDRIDHPVFVAILLDTCNEIFTESSIFFWELLNETIFE